MVCWLPVRRCFLAGYCVLLLCITNAVAWPAAEMSRQGNEDLPGLHREQRLLSQPGEALLSQTDNLSASENLTNESETRNGTSPIGETSTTDGATHTSITVSTTPHNSTTTTSATTSTTAATLTTWTSSTSTSTMGWPEVRVVGTTVVLVMNAYTFAEHQFANAAVTYGLSRWASVDMSAVSAAIVTERRLLNVRRLQASSTKATVEFTIRVFRSQRQQAETEFDRLSALVDSVKISSVTSHLRYALASLSISLPLRAVSLDANVSLIIPGEGAVRYGPTTAAALNTSEQAQVQDMGDWASGVGHLLALWSIIAYYSLEQL